MKPVEFAPVVILANRVKLRLMEDRDALALFQLYGDPDVMQYWGHAAGPILPKPNWRSKKHALNMALAPAFIM